jgi:hypothetical protein
MSDTDQRVTPSQQDAIRLFVGLALDEWPADMLPLDDLPEWARPNA